MNILLISQCAKKALPETRRVLDHFAERKGDRTWQTAITMQGLNTLRKMLKQKARRNTAVACHRIGGKNHSELLWIVGNATKFNEEGTVPTNTTSRDVLKSRNEDEWNTIEDIAILASIAALFHDFGKANVLFQKKLDSGARSSEPYRHEWVSLRLFQAFAAGFSDEQWLQRLREVSANDEPALLQTLKSYQDHPANTNLVLPFDRLAPVAQVVAWLIVSHHRLPQSPPSQQANIKFITYFIEQHVVASWNSPQIENYNQAATLKDKKALRDVWHFKHGTPLKSITWCKKAHNIAKRTLVRKSLLKPCWLDDTFTVHMARLVLMFADHCFSSLDGNKNFRDNSYKANANTHRQSGKAKQRLDEHLIGVYRHTLQFCRFLPSLKNTLPSIGKHPAFKKRSADKHFAWQNKAFDLAYSMRRNSQQQGFFCVNLASTGRGKTFANARIMYALSDEKRGCRFNVALGLRTLTLQTGDAFKERLYLDDDDLAVLIGSEAVKKLHEHEGENIDKNTGDKNQDATQDKIRDKVFGSESANTLVEENTYVRYEGIMASDGLEHWLKSSPKLHKLISAPIVVSTIDHLMPATEGVRGGKQIAPMLRLLTSDLVLDEPDDFSLEDIPALTRLVHWAGMLGSRVLLSSATLSPELVAGLFEAYCQGRSAFNKTLGDGRNVAPVCCAWFDERDSVGGSAIDQESFAQQHSIFIAKRVAQLNKQEPLRRTHILPLRPASQDLGDILDEVANSVYEGLKCLHEQHHECHGDNNVRLSFGLVRIANINPLVALAKRLMQRPSPPDTIIHYCIYHSQFPLCVRSGIETQLDATLNRKKPTAIWQSKAVKAALKKYPAKQHIFVVLASPVAEIGRDHDYDWAIAEPSSMRSLVQLAGRLQRHRQHVSEHPNLWVLEKNIRALKGEKRAFHRPGFEVDKERVLQSRSMMDVLSQDQLAIIRSTPCIQTRDSLKPRENLADLEHNETKYCMQGVSPRDPFALQCLKNKASLTAELQTRTPFRGRREPQDDYFLFVDEGESSFVFTRWHESGEPKPTENIVLDSLIKAEGVDTWAVQDYLSLINQLSEALDKGEAEVSRIFGAVSLRRFDNNRLWVYNPKLGFYQRLDAP